ncbi:hypothetical protein GEMRC1_000325 [Eukaryota sp. GEM-RC1]
MSSLRGLPVTSLLENYRMKLVDWFTSRLNEGRHLEKKKSTVMKSIRQQLCENQTKSIRMKVSLSTKQEVIIGEVCDGTSRYIVDVNNWTCTCNGWQRDGFPCSHGLAVAREVGHRPVDCTDKVFLVQNFIETYATPIMPMKQRTDWVKAINPESLPLPPLVKKSVGRPRRKRVDVFRKKRVRKEKEDDETIENMMSDDRWLLGDIIDEEMLDDSLSDEDDQIWQDEDEYSSSGCEEEV